MKRRPWKLVLASLALIGITLGAILWSIHRRADAVFERHDRAVSEITSGIRQRPHRRARLYDPVKPGDGWRDYEAAMVGFAAIPDPDLDEIPEVNPDSVPDPETLEDLFAKHAGLLGLLRESNRCAEFHPNYQYEAGFFMNLPNVTTAIRAARYLSGQAAHFADSGRISGALESLVLGLALAHDTGRAGPIVNHLVLVVCETVEIDKLRDLLKSTTFTAGDLETLARRLDLLWEARPELPEAFVSEDALIRRTLVDLGGSGGALNLAGTPGVDVGWGRSWRFLGSRRLACAGALGELENLLARSRELRDRTPRLRQAEMDQLNADAKASRNPIIAEVFPALSKVWKRETIARMNWTLMRAAVAVAWFSAEKGAFPTSLKDLVPRYLPEVPECPLTGLPFGYRYGKIWSAGLNGVDDGGTPGKDDDLEAADGDAVWTVKRK